MLEFTIFGESDVLYFSYIDPNGVSWPENCPADHFVGINKDDGDKGRGLGIAHNQLIVFKTNSMYLVSGTSKYDISIYLLSKKEGCISPYTISNTRTGECIFLSRNGVCLTDASSVVNLSEGMISNIFNGEGNPPWTVDVDRLPYATGVYNPTTNRYRVWLASSGSTKNDKYIEYDFNKIDDVPIGWSEGDGIAMTCSATIEKGDKVVPIGVCDAGKGTAGKVWAYDYDYSYLSEGVGTTSTRSGSVASATADTLTDSSATFTDDALGCPITINGETKRIYSRTGDTITIEENWDTTPSENDTYVIGAIDCFRMSKWFDADSFIAKSIKKIKMAFKQAAYTCAVKIYQNFNSTTAKMNKSIDLNTAKGYREKMLGINRQRHFMVEVGNDGVDEPIEIKELEVTLKPEGKLEDA